MIVRIMPSYDKSVKEGKRPLLGDCRPAAFGGRPVDRERRDVVASGRSGFALIRRTATRGAQGGYPKLPNDFIAHLVIHMHCADMPTYHFHLQNSTGVTGDADVRHLADDQAAIMEARKAAGDLIADELVTQSATPLAVVTVEREGQPIAIVKAQGSVERISPIPS